MTMRYCDTIDDSFLDEATLGRIFVENLYAFYVSGALQITESDVTDQGKYECVANNTVGTEYSKSITLYVKRTYFNYY